MCISGDAVIIPILKLVNFHRAYICFHCVQLLILLFSHFIYCVWISLTQLKYLFLIETSFWPLNLPSQMPFGWTVASSDQIYLTLIPSYIIVFFLWWLLHSISGLTMHPAIQIRDLQLFFFLSIPHIQSKFYRIQTPYSHW